jgi:glycosyltransferase involved in cell wall biosynthesis
MGFASAYLEKRALFPQNIKEAVDVTTGIIVVVPAYNEPGIIRLLDSLAKCIEPVCKTEVIVVINAPDGATEEILENNSISLKNIESWKNENRNCFFRLFAFIIEHPIIKGWGVGLARKTGMDEAIRRFNSIDKSDGVILNLDADCTVSQNYFLAVYNELLKKTARSACSICFEHPLSGIEYPEEVFNYIALYELHLRYYFQGLDYSGFPYVFHTVGSAFAVKALAYIKAGGMNRRQAGEDFYFIQKLVPSGGYFNLNSTVVYPSPRASDRVPFGTGASIGKLTMDNGSTFLTYNILAFNELRIFFGLTDVFFDCGAEELQDKFSMIPPGLRLFLDEKEWIEKMTEVKKNTSGNMSFRKRFFDWFNMFRIVKYLNFVHIYYYEKKPVQIAAVELLEARGMSVDSRETNDLLLFYRRMEKPESVDSKDHK